jgi:hypothetical protein
MPSLLRHVQAHLAPTDPRRIEFERIARAAGVKDSDHPLLRTVKVQDSGRWEILAWAIIFGYAQQLFTRLVDQQGQTVLNSVRSADKAAPWESPGSGAMGAPRQP